MHRVRTVVAGLALVLVAGCTSTVGSAPASPTPVRTVATSGAPPAGGAPPSAAAAARAALTQLAHIAVRGRAPKTGYTRARFGQAWTDDTDDRYGHNGCDTRVIRTARGEDASRVPHLQP